MKKKVFAIVCVLIWLRVTCMSSSAVVMLARRDRELTARIDISAS